MYPSILSDQNLYIIKIPQPMQKKCYIIHELVCTDCKKRKTIRPFYPSMFLLKKYFNTTRLPAVGEHLRDKDQKLEDNMTAVITREENNFIRRIYEALKILSQSNRNGRFELPALYRDVLARDLVYSSSSDKYIFPPHSCRQLVIAETLPLLRYLVS